MKRIRLIIANAAVASLLLSISFILPSCTDKPSDMSHVSLAASDDDTYKITYYSKDMNDYASLVCSYYYLDGDGINLSNIIGEVISSDENVIFTRIDVKQGWLEIVVYNDPYYSDYLFYKDDIETGLNVTNYPGSPEYQLFGSYEGIQLSQSDTGIKFSVLEYAPFDGELWFKLYNQSFWNVSPGDVNTKAEYITRYSSR